jgi:hypothetical protein
MNSTPSTSGRGPALNLSVAARDDIRTELLELALRHHKAHKRALFFAAEAKAASKTALRILKSYHKLKRTFDNSYSGHRPIALVIKRESDQSALKPLYYTDILDILTQT